MHIIRIIHGGIFQNPYSERYAFAFKVVCADSGWAGVSIYCDQQKTALKARRSKK